MLLTGIMFMVSYIYCILLWHLKEVSCTFWYVGDWNSAYDLMFILHPALVYVEGELCILACW